MYTKIIKIPRITFFVFTAFSLFSSCKAQDNENNTESSGYESGFTQSIIPNPSLVEFNNANLELNGVIEVMVDPDYENAVGILQDQLMDLGFNTAVSSHNTNPHILYLKKDMDIMGSYEIIINQKQIVISFGDEVGAFYATQSLRQYLWSAFKNDKKKILEVPTVVIKDSPENQYRGFHIDVSRHFFPKEFIFKMIDQMALYKLNKLQLHLSDDQGWRIVSDKYPLLTKIGAFREFNDDDQQALEQAKSNPDYNFNPAFVRGNQYGGFYTKEDIKDIIAYAGKNYIEVIPEIDMPGHMSAAIRAYSWISCDGKENWGEEFSQPMCVCNEEVMDFAKNIWDEITALFPSNRVHIGADEVDKSFWEDEAVCRSFMEANGWDHVNQIQSYFVNEITKYLEAKGKRVVAWDDILVSNENLIKNDVPASIDIMFWRDYKPEGAIYAAQNGNDIILTPWTWFYLSSRNSDENFIAMYDFNEHEKLPQEVIDKKIGYQACVWTEHIPSEAVFEQYVFPRFQGYAEVAWSKERDFISFKNRLQLHLNYMDNIQINYKKPDFMN